MSDTPRKRGRPLLGEKPRTNAENARAFRARKAEAAEREHQAEKARVLALAEERRHIEAMRQTVRKALGTIIRKQIGPGLIFEQTEAEELGLYTRRLPEIVKYLGEISQALQSGSRNLP